MAAMLKSMRGLHLVGIGEISGIFHLRSLRQQDILTGKEVRVVASEREH